MLTGQNSYNIAYMSEANQPMIMTQFRRRLYDMTPAIPVYHVFYILYFIVAYSLGLFISHHRHARVLDTNHVY